MVLDLIVDSILIFEVFFFVGVQLPAFLLAMAVAELGHV